jgi:limonene-1,2-epoxide hydrolase
MERIRKTNKDLIQTWVDAYNKRDAAKGRTFRFEGCGFFKVRNRKIIFQRGYWDMKKWEKVTGTGR